MVKRRAMTVFGSKNLLSLLYTQSCLLHISRSNSFLEERVVCAAFHERCLMKGKRETIFGVVDSLSVGSKHAATSQEHTRCNIIIPIDVFYSCSHLSCSSPFLPLELTERKGLESESVSIQHFLGRRRTCVRQRSQ